VWLDQSDPYFSPAGLMVATDEQLHKLLEDLETLETKTPGKPPINGPDTGNSAGMSNIEKFPEKPAQNHYTLQVCYTCFMLA